MQSAVSIGVSYLVMANLLAGRAGVIGDAGSSCRRIASALPSRNRCGRQDYHEHTDRALTAAISATIALWPDIVSTVKVALH